jgi:hypothetical protein
MVDIGTLVAMLAAVVGSSWALSQKLSGVQTAVTEAIHAIDKRLTKVEAMQTDGAVSVLSARVDKISRKVDHIQWACTAKGNNDGSEIGT